MYRAVDGSSVEPTSASSTKIIAVPCDGGADPSLVRQFQTRYPGVAVDLHEAEPAMLEDLVAAGDIDPRLPPGRRRTDARGLRLHRADGRRRPGPDCWSYGLAGNEPRMIIAAPQMCNDLVL